MNIGLERADAVDEQIAPIAPQEEGADFERRVERQRLRCRGVKAGDHGVHRKYSSFIC
jgi:hypothetical protein